MSRSLTRVLIAASLLGSAPAAFATPILYQSSKYLTGSDDPVVQNPVKSTDVMSRGGRIQIFVPNFDLSQINAENQANRQKMLPK